MRVAIHARVSTSDKGQDPRNQLLELRRYSEGKANCAPIVEYVEQETATGKKRRPVFDQMLQDAERGRFEVLVIWAIDRLSREGPLKTMLLLDRMHRAGVKVKSLKEPWLDPRFADLRPSPSYIRLDRQTGSGADLRACSRWTRSCAVRRQNAGAASGCCRRA